MNSRIHDHRFVLTIIQHLVSISIILMNRSFICLREVYILFDKIATAYYRKYNKGYCEDTCKHEPSYHSWMYCDSWPFNCNIVRIVVIWVVRVIVSHFNEITFRWYELDVLAAKLVRISAESVVREEKFKVLLLFRVSVYSSGVYDHSVCEQIGCLIFFTSCHFDDVV